MAATEIIGSWFPTGYHGHFRSKSRTDFLCEYRHLAKPQPPGRFLNRSRQPTVKHVFSHHDNREAFLNDALYFEQGLGRRRNPNRGYSFKQDFITWMPEKEYVQRTTRPLTSTYRNDFKTKAGVPQIYVSKPKNSFETGDTTSYRYAHGSETANPNKTIINAMNNDALKLSLLNRKNRALSAKIPVRESVARCMTWHEADHRPQTAKVSTSVDTAVPSVSINSNYEPHPPSQLPAQNGMSTAPQGNVISLPPTVSPPEPQVVWQAPSPPQQTSIPRQPQPTVAWSAPQPVQNEVMCA